MFDPNADFVPINPADWIDPGSETIAQRLEACQVLAATSMTASAEIDAMWAAEGTEEFLPVHKENRCPSLRDTDNEQHALLRTDNALEALMREVQDMTCDGTLPLMIDASRNPSFAALLKEAEALRKAG